MKQDPTKEIKKEEPVKQKENKKSMVSQKSDVPRRGGIEQLCYVMLSDQVK